MSFIDDLLNDPERLDKLMKKGARELAEKEEKRELYYTTDFNTDLTELLSYIETVGSFCYDTWLYDIKGLPVKPSENIMSRLSDICHCVKTHGTELTDFDQDRFYSEKFTIGGLLVTLTYGQGTDIHYSLYEGDV